MLKIFAKMIVLPVMMILIALSFTVSILSKIHYLAAVLVNAIFIMCAVIALSLQQWQNFGIAVFVLAVSCMILKLWDIIEYAIGVICVIYLKYYRCRCLRWFKYKFMYHEKEKAPQG